MISDTPTGSSHTTTQQSVPYTLHDYEPSPYETAVECSTQMSPRCLNNGLAMSSEHIYAVIENSGELQTKPMTGSKGVGSSGSDARKTGVMDSNSFTQPHTDTPGNKTCATGAVGTSQPK